MPDDTLYAAAAAGALTREAVAQHAARLLDLPEAAITIGDFHDQLLRMQEYEEVSKNDDRFDGDVGEDLKHEAITFVEEIVLGQVGHLRELLTAPYTFGNERIADIYGQDVVSRTGGADEFARIELDPTRRAGILTQIGFLAANAEGPVPNSIMRGVHLAQRVLCVDMPPPPDMIPPFPDLSPDQTNRERVEVLTGDQACAGCHGLLINPVGFAFEAFDGLGQYREMDNGHPVDASSTYTIDGTAVSYNGAVEFTTAIATSQQAHGCYSRRWAEYIYGRDLDPTIVADANLIAQGGALSKSDNPIKELIVQLVATDAFLTRTP
jgi:hypothetical protein